MDNLQGYSEQIMAFLTFYGPVLLKAALTLLVGLWVIKLIVNIFNKTLTRAAVETSLHKFLLSLVNIALKTLLIISVISTLGVATTSFVAVLGAAGLAIGLALQGSLANFAGGVLILLFRPFKIGDFITAQGFSGTVNEIQVFQTILKTPDNKTIIIPNGGLSNGSITNFSTEKTRRVDMVFGISYNDDLLKAKKVLSELVKDDERVLTTPEPLIVVGELADSSVNFTVRVWTKSENYWGVFFGFQEKVKLQFDREGISIPFPQQDVHMHTVTN